jgi:hypothetical protein
MRVSGFMDKDRVREFKHFPIRVSMRGSGRKML